MASLDDGERSRAARFLFAVDRRAFVLAHDLTRRALSHHEPAVPPDAWRFVRRGRGRPELRPPFDRIGLRFNLSHTRGLVACVISRGLDCGVDVEVQGARSPSPGLAQRHLAQQELDDLLRIPPDHRPRRFLRYWTLKEARSKATGDGLRLDFRTLPFDLAATPAGGPSPPTTGGWHAWQWAPTDRHEAAVCVRAPFPVALLSNIAVAASGSSPP